MHGSLWFAGLCFASFWQAGSAASAPRTQVSFTRPAGMKVFWFIQKKDGKAEFSRTPLEVPGRYNFIQGGTYRLKLTHIPGHAGLELYPTLEVVSMNSRTKEFLAHNNVPVSLTEDDIKHVTGGSYLVKVVYLPDPRFQDASGPAPGAIASTTLEAGQDPIREAMRRGSVLLVLRIGNIDGEPRTSPR